MINNINFVLYKVREYISISIGIVAAVMDIVLVGFLIYSGFFLYRRAQENMQYAGWPPLNYESALLYVTDPYLVSRLTSWGIVVGCMGLIIVLIPSIIEGTWAVLRRI